MSAVAAQRRPFTVADFNVTNFPLRGAQSASDRMVVSPDGRQFVTITQRGDPATGLVEFSLLLFDTAQVRIFVNSDGTGPRPKETILASFESSELIGQGVPYDARTNGIYGVRWLPGGQTLAFLGRNGESFPQVYVLDVMTRKMRSLTPQPRGYIASFELSLEHHRLGYAACVVPEKTRWNVFLKEHIVGVGDFAKLRPILLNGSDPDPVARNNVRYFIEDLVQGRTVEVDLEPGGLDDFYEMTFDPTGRWAVARTSVSKVPAHWIDYPSVAYGGLLPVRVKPGTQVLEYENPSSGVLEASQLQLIDLVAGGARPLLDSPVKTDAESMIAWSSDGASVVISASALPLGGTSDMERIHKATMQAILEVEVASGKYAVVADLAQGPRSQSGRVLTQVIGLARTADGHICALWSGYNPNLSRRENRWMEYRRKGSAWAPNADAYETAEADSTMEVAAGALRLRIAEDRNMPPEIVARDIESNRERAITDLNPQLREIDLARVELFKWTDRFGREWQGTMFRPTTVCLVGKCPAVLQAGTSDFDKFSLDGTGYDLPPYAAQALASRGFFVMGMPQSASYRGRASTGVTEIESFTAAVESAIDALDKQDLIDRSRVGLIGFSRAGMLTHGAITFSKYPIAAAIVADATTLSPWAYTAAGYGEGAVKSGRGYVGVPLWGTENVKTWTERSYLFNLHRISSAVLYEEHGSYFPAHWESYAILRSFSRPVEMVRLTRTSHPLHSPDLAYRSRQRTVDWMRFWLKGEVDDDPDKAEQWARWRQMKTDWQRIQKEEAGIGKGPIALSARHRF